jgi:NDP-sugar pyrophosphorylase family protein
MIAGMPKVAILAGGFGTRLGALTADLPKPMIELAGRPFLERVIDSFASRGLRDLVLLVGYRAGVIEEHFGSGSRYGVRIEYSIETEPLGTGGAIREARELLGDRFILTFGDVLRYHEYDRFVREHDGPALAVYPRRTIGNAAVDGARITRFDKRDRTLPYLDAGFSLMPVRTIDLLPRAGACSFEEIVYPTLAKRGELQAEIVDQNFYDIGDPDELARTRAALEGKG